MVNEQEQTVLGLRRRGRVAFVGDFGTARFGRGQAGPWRGKGWSLYENGTSNTLRQDGQERGWTPHELELIAFLAG